MHRYSRINISNVKRNVLKYQLNLALLKTSMEKYLINENKFTCSDEIFQMLVENTDIYYVIRIYTTHCLIKLKELRCRWLFSKIVVNKVNKINQTIIGHGIK